MIFGKYLIIFVGFLCLISNSLLAVPLLQDDSASTLTHSDYNKAFSASSDIDVTNGDADIRLMLGIDAEQVSLDTINSEILLTNGQNLKNLNYSEYGNNEFKGKFNHSQNYIFQNTEQRQRFNANLFTNSNSGVLSIFAPLKNNVQIREGVEGILDVIKNTQALFVMNSEITYENSNAASQYLINSTIERQLNQDVLQNRGITSSTNKVKYDASLFKNFFAMIAKFLLYVVAGGILIKLLLLFAAWSRRKNTYRRHRSKRSNNQTRQLKHKRHHKHKSRKSVRLTNNKLNLNNMFYV